MHVNLQFSQIEVWLKSASHGNVRDLPGIKYINLDKWRGG
jgi:hypothetical protein